MRLEYARRRAALVDGAAARACPGPRRGQGAATPARPRPFRLLGDTAGMHVVLELPAGLRGQRLVVAAAAGTASGLPAGPVLRGPADVSGLILGYGAAPLTQVRRAAGELARC